MKKKLLFGMLAMVLVLGMVLVGCDNGNDTPTKETIDGPEIVAGSENTDPKTIKVTGITGFTGVAQIVVFSDLNDTPTDGGWPKRTAEGEASISDGTLTISLMISSEPWTGYGSYYIYAVPKVDGDYSSLNGRIYMGSGSSPRKYNINEAEITLQYNSFKMYNVYK